MSDPSIIVCVPFDEPGGYLPITEFAPLVERIAELERVVAQQAERLACIAGLASA